MYTNLSMAMAQDHQRELRREAEAAKLARSGAETRPVAGERWLARIRLTLISRRPTRRFQVHAAEQPRLG
jgi:hypothetical protein